MTTFTTADVNTWFQTIDGLPIDDCVDSHRRLRRRWSTS